MRDVGGEVKKQRKKKSQEGRPRNPAAKDNYSYSYSTDPACWENETTFVRVSHQDAKSLTSANCNGKGKKHTHGAETFALPVCPIEHVPRQPVCRPG